MNIYHLLIDTWEGQLDIDEAVLKANGVAGMMIRLNDINGGHHKDEYFDTQWEQARGFVRVPYFVYNPWVNGSQNFEWLSAHMPDEAIAVAADIEVVKSGYPASTYAAEVEIFNRLCKTRWNTVFYTGQWFLEYLSYWPIDVDYWWAQYPYAFYPSSARSLTWDQLRAELEPFSGPSNATYCPGPIRMWQFTGDRLILPGNPKPMDVNAFFGTYAELEAFFGKADGGSPPDEVVTHPYAGTEQHEGTLNGQKYILQYIDLAGKRVKVRHFNGNLRRVEDAAKLDNAQIVVNGDDYTIGGGYYPNGMSYTDGKQYTPPFEARYWMNVNKSNVITWGKGNPPADVYNLTSFIRPMVVNGQLHYGLFEDKIENKEIHARTLEGVDAKGRQMILICEGRVNPDTGVAYAGVTLPQAAQLMKDKGAVFAGEHGSGGDSGLYSLGTMQNISSDVDAGKGWRGVVQVKEFFIDGGNMPIENGIAKENLGKSPSVRSAPDVSGSKVYSLPQYTEFEFVEIVPGSKVASDQWVKLEDGNYVNYIVDGKTYLEIVKMPDNGTGGELPAYFTAFDADGNELARYSKE